MPRIMIADDDATIQMELEEYLTHVHYDIVGTVDTGIGAVEMARMTKPDLILMDVNMPGELDGISAAEKIKSEVDSAVVFITGFGDPEHIERAKKVEPFGYVMKPFDEKEINGIIEIVLHKRELELSLKKANRELEKEIEKRKKTEKALRASEEKHKLFFEQAGDAIFIHDRQARMLAVNPTACELLGYTHAELMSMTIEQVDTPEEARHVSERIAKLMARGHLVFETVHQCKDGSSVPFEVNARLITWEDEPAMMSICRDLTERKRMEKAMAESELKHNTLISC